MYTIRNDWVDDADTLTTTHRSNLNTRAHQNRYDAGASTLILPVDIEKKNCHTGKASGKILLWYLSRSWALRYERIEEMDGEKIKVHEIINTQIYPLPSSWLGLGSSGSPCSGAGGWSHWEYLSQQLLTNRPLEFFHNSCIAGYPMYETSAKMGVPGSCGPGSKAPIKYSVSYRWGGVYFHRPRVQCPLAQQYSSRQKWGSW